MTNEDILRELEIAHALYELPHLQAYPMRREDQGKPRDGYILDAMRRVVLQAYEEAARIADSMTFPGEPDPSLDGKIGAAYTSGHDNACRGLAKHLRALKDSLVQESAPV